MRRTKPEKRSIIPDVRYNSEVITHLIARIMTRGKKSLALSLVYGAMDIVKEKTGKDEMEVLEQALRNVGPIMEVRPRRVGGSTYQVPMEVPTSRRMTLAMRWIISSSHARSGKSFSEKLAAEIVEAANNQGASIRRREEAHKMAEANRAFAHFRV